MVWVTRYLVAQDGLSEYVGRAISWLTLGMIGVLLIEIAARYFFNAPTLWAHETSTMLYGAFCMLAGAYTLRHRGHVRSEVIWGALPKRGQAFCDVLIFSMGAVVLAIFLKLAIAFAAESWAVLEYSNKSMWQPPLYPIKTLIMTTPANGSLTMISTPTCCLSLRTPTHPTNADLWPNRAVAFSRIIKWKIWTRLP